MKFKLQSDYIHIQPAVNGGANTKQKTTQHNQRGKQKLTALRITSFEFQNMPYHIYIWSTFLTEILLYYRKTNITIL